MREGLRIVNQRIFELFEPIEPFDTGTLHVAPPHALYFEQSGNPQGIPVLFLHGGPGSGASAVHRQFFDPAAYRIVIFDQRGAGRSTPHGDLTNNTTQDLIADIELLRTQLGIERWMVFGGSWGSTLSLAYAQAHPERVTAMVMRGIFLGSPREIDWFVNGIRNFFPDAWDRFVTPLQEDRRGDPLATYWPLLNHEHAGIALNAARTWSVYEGTCSTLLPNAELVSGFASERTAIGLARIEAHYMRNALFLKPGELLASVPRIRHIPAVIVQGRYDMVCPPRAAFELAAAWPEAEFIVIPDAGHSAFEKSTRSALIAATERMKDVLFPQV